MEMVKVDVQKLQLLNDRIAQTIDALNQVRLSVAGIQHTGPSPWGTPYGYGGSPYNVQPSYPTPFATPFSPFQTFAQPYTPWNAGIQHTPTTPFTTTYGYPTQVQPTQYTTGYTRVTPYTGIQHTTPPTTAGWPWSNGISHTSWEPTWQGRTW